jgi:hypothetical protein
MRKEKCANCGALVEMYINPYTKVFEPVSNYWKGKDKYQTNIIEIYCSAKCSLKKHERDKNGNGNEIQSQAGMEPHITCMD